MKTNKEPLPLLNVEKMLSILGSISLFGGLTDLQLDKVIKELRIMACKKDSVIFNKGEQPSYIYIVQSGGVKIVTSLEGTTLELFSVEPGGCFGETSLIGIQPHSATAIATQNSELIILSRDALLALFNQDKELYSMMILNIARETSRHLHNSRADFVHYANTHK